MNGEVHGPDEHGSWDEASNHLNGAIGDGGEMPEGAEPGTDQAWARRRRFQFRVKDEHMKTFDQLLYSHSSGHWPDRFMPKSFQAGAASGSPLNMLMAHRTSLHLR